MVGARGFEPPTPDTPCQCATRLRYAPIKIMEGWSYGTLKYWGLRRKTFYDTFKPIIPSFQNSIIPIYVYYSQFSFKSPVSSQSITTTAVPLAPTSNITISL